MGKPSKQKRGGPEEASVPLQAVLLADSFTQRFRPITVEKPKALLPLVNTPLLEYTLEWLAASRVEEVWVFCCAHARQITEYIEQSKWSSVPGFVLHTIVSTDCVSAGDALRLVDQRNVIRSDFVLISADVVANFNLDAALEAHRKRREKDKLAIMTTVMKRVSAPHRQCRLGDSNVVAAINPTTNQLVYYDEHATDRFIPLDSALFSEHRALQVRTDLLDCHVDICSPEVLMLMTDNFDYQHLRRDFISGTLKEAELGNKIYVHELTPREYAVRVHNLRTYDAVSRDIVRRWVYPLVLDNNVLPLGTDPTYSYARLNVYKEDGVNVARTATIGPDSVLGRGSAIGEHTVLKSTIVGRDCSIGHKCILDGSYLHDGVFIRDNVRMVSALACQGVVIHAGATIEPGCILAHNVVVSAGFTLPAYTRLSLHPQPLAGDVDSSDDELEYAAAGTRGGGDDDEEEDDDTVVGFAALSPELQAAVEAAKAGRPLPAGCEEWDAAGVGPCGAGHRWELRQGSDEAWHLSIAPAPTCLDPLADDDLLEDDIMSAHGEFKGGASRRTGDGDGDEDDEDEEDEEMQREAWFRKEVVETFLRCIKNGYEESNIVVELQGLKLAENRTFADLARYMLTTLLGLCLPATEDTAKENRALYPSEAPESSGKLLAGVKPRLSKWSAMLQRFLKNDDDQVEVLLTLEEFCSEEDVFRRCGGARYVPIFAQLLHAIYDADILSEDAILAWADEKKGADEADRKYVNLAQPFLNWLQEADEDSSEEEDD